MAEVEYFQGTDCRALAPGVFLGRVERFRKVHQNHLRFLAKIAGRKLKG